MTDLQRDNAELIACPFCGSTEQSPIESVVQLCHNEWHPEHNPEGDWWTVQCDHCTATMGQFRSPDKAIAAWNTRSLSPQPDTDAVEDEVQSAITELECDVIEARGDDLPFAHVRVDALRTVLAALNASTPEIQRMRALISEDHIERLAADIAIACVDCRKEIVEARHRAMVRLGERLRNPLSTDLRAIDRAALKQDEENHDK